MGYQTWYDLNIEPRNQEILDYIEQNEDLYAIQENHDTCKWYDHEKDMKKLSKLFPDTVFSLKGEGEEAEDIWFKHFKNGKMQECYAKITFDEYDESKLR